MDESPHVFTPFGAAHLVVICLTITLPFLFAALARRTKCERPIVVSLSALLVINYIAFMCLVGRFGAVSWKQVLPLQLCDWGMVVVIVAMLTGSQRWFEVAYFWGIGGTLQAVLTP